MAIAKTNKHPSEHIEQVRVVTWFDRCQPTLRGRLMAIPNGGQRNLTVATKLKAEGVRAGVPDLFLPVPVGGSNGLWIEMKAAGGRVSEKQKDWLDYLDSVGYTCKVCFGSAEAIETIEKYLAGGEM